MTASGRSPLKAAPPVHSQVSRERTITITSELAPIVVIRCLAMRAGTPVLARLQPSSIRIWRGDFPATPNQSGNHPPRKLSSVHQVPPRIFHVFCCQTQAKLHIYTCEHKKHFVTSIITDVGSRSETRASPATYHGNHAYHSPFSSTAFHQKEESNPSHGGFPARVRPVRS
jgi:hypothetical protein